MIVKIFILEMALFIFGAGMMHLIHRSYDAGVQQKKLDWVKYGIFFIIVNSFLLSLFAGLLSLCLLLCIIAAAASYEIWDISGKRLKSGWMTTGAFAIIVSLCLSHLLFLNIERGQALCALLLLLVFATDSYGQLTGRLIGRIPLCRDISPNKTVEGLLGGLLAAVICAAGFSLFLTQITAIEIIILAIITALSATAGDLLFSAVKRKIEIKDYSNLIPGHGGMLDRFDSLIVAAPVFFWSLFILDYLSGGQS